MSPNLTAMHPNNTTLRPRRPQHATFGMRRLAFAGLIVLQLVAKVETHAAIAGFGYGYNFGQNATTQGLYEVNYSTGIAAFLTSLTPTFTSANGLAYFNGLGSNGSIVYGNDADSRLAVVNRANLSQVIAGDLTTFTTGAFTGAIKNGTSYNGSFYTIAQGTDDLWKIDFNSGTFLLSSAVKVADVANNTKSYGFGDIAISSAGILYASAINIANNDPEFFSYNVSALNSQTTLGTGFYNGLGFGTNGLLYASVDSTGHSWNEINTATGNVNSVIGTGLPFTLADLTQASPTSAVPEPASTALLFVAGLALVTKRRRAWSA